MTPIKAPRFDCFDIEATNLKANFGHMLCVCFVPLHSQDVVVFRLDDKKYKPKKPYDDSKLAEAVKEYMEDSFCWISWYGKMFDVPFINTRLLLADRDPLQKRMHIDLLYYSRKPNLALHSSRLDAVAKTFNFADQKTDLNPAIWNAAQALEQDAMDYVVEHCIQDVKVLQEAFAILQPFIKNVHY